MNVFKIFIGILTVNFTFSEDILKEDFFDELSDFFLISLPPSLAYLFYFILRARAHTRTLFF